MWSLQHQPVIPHQEVRSHILILSDPNGSAHVGWAEMYDGRFIPALKMALEAAVWSSPNESDQLRDPGGCCRKMTMSMVEFSRLSAAR